MKVLIVYFSPPASYFLSLSHSLTDPKIIISTLFWNTSSFSREGRETKFHTTTKQAKWELKGSL